MRYPRCFSFLAYLGGSDRKEVGYAAFKSTGLILSRKNKCQLILICQYSSLPRSLSIQAFPFSPLLCLLDMYAYAYLIYMHLFKLNILIGKMLSEPLDAIRLLSCCPVLYFVCADHNQQGAPLANNTNAHTQNTRTHTHLFQLAVTG